jgi:peptidyl-tRNA hydrolase, PTH1 family
MKLILAQGNPGSDYAKTRHNVGFLAIEGFANNRGAQFKNKAKFNADIAELTVAGEKVLLAKPTTFYNETGQSARAIADFYKIDATDILVIHDELALPFGTIRTREKGSDAGNNGIKSLNAHLGEQYARIRIGIHTDIADRMDTAAFVLSSITASESEKLQQDIFPKTAELIDNFIADQHLSTSHTL